MEYHTNKFTAIIGGVLKNGMELLERVLLINSLMDTAVHIHFYGEVAMAALYAIGIDLGKVERIEENHKDYEKCKDFFLSIYKRGIMSTKVKFFFPHDFKVCQKIEVEDSI